MWNFWHSYSGTVEQHLSAWKSAGCFGNVQLNSFGGSGHAFRILLDPFGSFWCGRGRRKLYTISCKHIQLQYIIIYYYNLLHIITIYYILLQYITITIR